MSTLYGWGVNDADYPVSPRNPSGKRKECPYYTKWRGMISRVHCESYLKRFPTYRKVSVCAEWKYFSNFKAWMTVQDWEGKELDKDLLSGVLYSPKNCLFVSKRVNYVILGLRGRPNGLPTGVHFNKEKRKYQAMCSDPFGKKTHLGYYLDANDAHAAWRGFKVKMLVSVAEREYDYRVRGALVRLAMALQRGGEV